MTDRGMQHHRSLGNCGADSACAFHRGAVAAFRATDYGENLEVIQLVHLYCGAWFCRFFGALVSDTGAGGAGTTRESDSGLVRHICIISS